jgi:hypothetical protein
LPTVGVKCSSKETPFREGPGKQCRLSQIHPELREQSAKGNISTKFAAFRYCQLMLQRTVQKQYINFEIN